MSWLDIGYLAVAFCLLVGSGFVVVSVFGL